jgi:RNA polymerase sigma factor (sigma-70 family)
VTTTDDGSIPALVARARAGDQAAWDRIVELHAPLVRAVCARHRLSAADADDVAATVWLRLVERLNTIREPAALPGWLATTTRNECLQLLRTRNRNIPMETEDVVDDGAPAADDWLVREERFIALRAAFTQLSEKCQRLLSLLFTEPPIPYVEISGMLGMAVGGIGPNRMRCLEMLRRTNLIAALMDGRRPGHSRR